MKALVIGTGSAGKRHINNLTSCGIEVISFSYRNLTLTDFSSSKKESFSCSENEALQENYDFVVIANTTNKHIDTAIKAAELSKNIYLEKPISNSLNRTNELIEIVEKNKLIFDAGFILRSHPNLIWINKFIKSNDLGNLLYADVSAGHLLSDWRPGRDYRKSYSALKDMGGGVIFDLIHEIDIVYWLLGEIKEVFCMTSDISFLEIETESVANILMRLKNKQIVHTKIDYVRPNYSRKAELVYQNGIIYWDYLKGQVFLEKKGQDAFLVNSTPKEFKRNDIFLIHMNLFIRKLKQPYKKDLSTLKDACEVLKVALAAHKSAKQNKNIFIS